MNKNYWLSGPAASGMSSPWRPVPRNFRVECPHYHTDDSSEWVIFADRDDALTHAQKWASEDERLYLVWDFAATMYIGRFDGRTGGFCDSCDKWADHLTTVDGDNPDKVRDECVFCRLDIPR